MSRSWHSHSSRVRWNNARINVRNSLTCVSQAVLSRDADVVMFVYREEYYLARKMPGEDSPAFNEWQEQMERVYGIAETIIAKQRNGPIGNVKLQFFSDQTRFDDLVKEDHLPQHIG